MAEFSAHKPPRWLELGLRHQPWRPRQLRWVLRDLAGMRQPEQDHRTHLRATLEWVCRAQDACRHTPCSGCVPTGWAFELGWLPADLDDTGWLIETCLPAAYYLDWPTLTDRARAMLEALLLQPDAPSPGRIHGLLAGHNQLDHPECLAHAMQSGHALLAAPTPGITDHAQHARTLAMLGSCTQDAVFTAAAQRHLDAVLTQQTPSGWFAIASAPSPTHQLAGLIRCVIEAAVYFDDARALTRARRSAEVLRQQLIRTGSLAGAYDDGWTPADGTAGVLALAQLSAVWLRLAQLDPPAHKSLWQEAAWCALGWIKRCQRTTGRHLALRDALPSAVPIWRGPSAFRFDTRSAKHFADALMMDMVGITIPPTAKMSPRS